MIQCVSFFSFFLLDGLLTGTVSINIIRNLSCSLPTYFEVFFFFFIPHDVKACENFFI